jgi:hypothetical protein
MQDVVGIFESLSVARRAVSELRASGVSPDALSLLAPGTLDVEVEGRVNVDDGESPGTGAAVGGVVGGAIGIAAASLVLPGVGPITVAGLLLTAIAGAAGGGAAGDALENRLSDGLPHDELVAYEHALAAGRAVVIVTVETDAHADEARHVLQRAGAQSVDAARADWATGLHASAS